MKIVHLCILMLAFVLFLLSGFGIAHPRYNLLAWGLAFLALAQLVVFVP